MGRAGILHSVRRESLTQVVLYVTDSIPVARARERRGPHEAASMYTPRLTPTASYTLPFLPPPSSRLDEQLCLTPRNGQTLPRVSVNPAELEQW